MAVDGVLLPDVAARQPGRGAYLHPTTTCFDLAVRRRALARALRLGGTLDDTAVHAFVQASERAARESKEWHGTAEHQTDTSENDSGSGSYR